MWYVISSTQRLLLNGPRHKKCFGMKYFGKKREVPEEVKSSYRVAQNEGRGGRNSGHPAGTVVMRRSDRPREGMNISGPKAARSAVYRGMTVAAVRRQRVKSCVHARLRWSVYRPIHRPVGDRWAAWDKEQLQAKSLCE